MRRERERESEGRGGGEDGIFFEKEKENFGFVRLDYQQGKGYGVKNHYRVH